MEGISRNQAEPASGSGSSPLVAVKVMDLAAKLGIERAWTGLWLGHPTARRSAYRAEHRIRALLAGLACGLRGISAGNQWLRHDPAIRRLCDDRFPDQGTIHRWLEDVTPPQVLELRRHLQQSVRQHGRFRHQLGLPGGIIVDVDAQGIVAAGQRFVQAKLGWMGDGFERGFQRLVCYCASTGEILDEQLQPGDGSLLTGMSRLLDSLDELFAPEDRSRVRLRGDGHAGTIATIARAQQAGYQYVLKLFHSRTVGRIRQAVADLRGEDFPTPQGTARCWDVPAWTLTNKDGPQRSVTTRVVLFADPPDDQGHCQWWAVAVSEGVAAEFWQMYRDRGGAIEEYFDQSFRAYHLEIKRTSGLTGLEAVHLLAGLCWNLLRWELAELQLPPATAPTRSREAWVRADELDLSAVLERSRYSGLRFRTDPDSGAVIAEDTLGTSESAAWSQWLKRPVQRLLLLAG
jgi:hypothetical protein